jgi:hypothetical protein
MSSRDGGDLSAGKKIVERPLFDVFGKVVDDVLNSTTTFETDLTSTVDDFYKFLEVLFVSGTNKGQARRISAYSGTTKFITVDTAFAAEPAATDEFYIVPRVGVGGTGGIGSIADAVWDELISGHSGAGATGKALLDALADTNELQVDWVNGGRLDLLIDLILGDTAELQADWHDGGRLDLIIDTLALEATLTAIKGAGWAAGDNLKNLHDEVGVIDGFHDVPAADSVDNAQMRDVLGQKGDTAFYGLGSTSSLMRYLKSILGGLWGGLLFTASASTVNSITTASLVDVASKYIGRVVVPLTGNMANEGRIISAYDGTQTLTVHRAWPEAPGNVAFIVMGNPLGDLFDGSKGLESIYDLADAILDLTETGGTLTADGTEQTVWTTDAPSGSFEPRVVFIEATNMAASDSITIKEYYRIKSGGSYVMLDTRVYSDAQTRKLIKVTLEPNRYGIKVTLQQTAGTNRNYDWEVLYSG